MTVREIQQTSGFGRFLLSADKCCPLPNGLRPSRSNTVIPLPADATMHLNTLLASLAILLASSVARAETIEVRIEKMLFTPDVVRVKVGDTVLWKNTELRGYHTVWFQQEKLEESPPLFPDDTWQRTFTAPGEYLYNCGPHPWMTGKVIVD